MSARLRRTLVLTLGLLAVVRASAYDFGPWPAGGSPQEVGRRVADRFVASPHPNHGRPTPPRVITYPEVCAWYGALVFADLSHDATLQARLAARFEPLFREEKHLVPVPDHVDYTVFGAVPLELARQTGDRRCLALGEWMALKQWSEPFGPRTTAESHAYYRQGYTWQTRLWIDDMFMITAVQAQAYRATGNRAYIDRAAREMVLYLDRLQQPNGLFFHAPQAPFCWARGNGWMAAGMSLLLRELPADNPDRTRILRGYTLMMEALLWHQAGDGMWRQLVDDPAAWPETSGTGMFTFAFITGVQAGWLEPARYGPAARKAWLRLITYLNADGDVREVCQGTNIHDPAKHGPDGRAYYLARARLVGDMHGQAPVLWCAAALLRDAAPPAPAIRQP
ncbi:glycoside hydrolase family 88 protein [Opitutus sp. ER46]|uniref:glycoside hydrolase family 88/105 protein n=1 Tax=Opitutus sp. ER46 TaxID=2161864 RepID=UPI000D302A36|nr:glycoside hydrolase family 88 protein [Opitutus sp. ER46]PTX90949.1 glycosyl hydrolase [Opitutus sp. ER46]